MKDFLKLDWEPSIPVDDTPNAAMSCAFVCRDDFLDERDVVAYMNMDAPVQEQEAWARLFAAAPILYKACKEQLVPAYKELLAQHEAGALEGTLLAKRIPDVKELLEAIASVEEKS